MDKPCCSPLVSLWNRYIVLSWSTHSLVLVVELLPLLPLPFPQPILRISSSSSSSSLPLLTPPVLLAVRPSFQCHATTNQQLSVTNRQNRLTDLLLELRRHKVAWTNKKSSVVHTVVAKVHRCALLLLLAVALLLFHAAYVVCWPRK